MTIETSLEVADPRWTSFISAHADATIFHHPAWIGMLAACYGYKPRLAVNVDNAGHITAGLPWMEVHSHLTGRRGVALPFSDYCAPIVDNDEALVDLISGLQEARKACRLPRLEIRWPLPEQERVYAGDTMLRHVTPLAADPKQVATRFKSSTMRLVRQAEKAAVTIRVCRTWSEARWFYNLHLQTRRRLGVPIQPLRFFRLLWDQLLSQGLGFVLLAFKGHMPIAGAVFLQWNRILTYKYGASLSEYWALRPNNLLFWHAIRLGCEDNCQLFDWGRTDIADEGLSNFKRGWGSDELRLQYSVLADQPPARPKPTVVQHRLASVVQRSPLWVGRLIGELLYGHFA
jgi:CelD/BcsL family acetyltransferase involved in cellulose biosynthesis